MILDLLRSDGSIVVNKKLARIVGIDAAIMYSELVSRFFYFADRNQLTEDGYFFNTVDDMEEATTLSDHQQRKAVKQLVEVGLIKEKRMGLPARRYFYIEQDENIIIGVLQNKFLKNCRTESLKSEELELKKVQSNNTKLNNTNFNNNNNNNDDARKSLFKTFQENFGRLLNPIEADKIGRMEDDHGLELVEYALEIAILHGIRNISYIQSILNDWHAKSLKTVFEVQEYEERRKSNDKPKSCKPVRFEAKQDEEPEFDKLSLISWTS